MYTFYNVDYSVPTPHTGCIACAYVHRTTCAYTHGLSIAPKLLSVARARGARCITRSAHTSARVLPSSSSAEASRMHAPFPCGRFFCFFCNSPSGSPSPLAQREPFPNPAVRRGCPAPRSARAWSPRRARAAHAPGLPHARGPRPRPRRSRLSLPCRARRACHRSKAQWIPTT